MTTVQTGETLDGEQIAQLVRELRFATKNQVMRNFPLLEERLVLAANALEQLRREVAEHKRLHDESYIALQRALEVGDQQDKELAELESRLSGVTAGTHVIVPRELLTDTLKSKLYVADLRERIEAALSASERTP